MSRTSAAASIPAMRRRAKIDTNQPAIVAALRDAGCSVVSLATIGGGVPDLLVARGRLMRLVEVKQPKGHLTPDQGQFFAAWNGPAIAVVRSVEDALALLSSDE